MGLHEHLQTGCTTVARCWQVTRADGFIYGFTDHDADLTFEDVTFRADGGLSARALAQSTGLSVDNSEAVGMLSDASISETEIEQGRFDGADVVSWLVNWARVDERMVQFRGALGDIRRGSGAFYAELRGLTDALNQPRGRVFQRQCSAVLGDAECGVSLDAAPFAYEISVGVVTGGTSFQFGGLSGVDLDWFTRGTLRVMTGSAAGLSGVIKSDSLTSGDTAGRYRVDRTDLTEMSAIEAVRVEPETYVPQGDNTRSAVRLRAAPVAIPVETLFLDLPHITGKEPPQTLRVAAASRPWPGAVAVYASPQLDTYALETVLERPSVIGVTQTNLKPSKSGRWDRGGDLVVKLIDGALSSQSKHAIFAGRNIALIGNGSADRWEVIQFSDAELIGPRTYAIRRRLRGQAGTESVAPFGWPSGSRFLMLSRALGQVDLPSAARDTQWQFRVGPAARAFDDPTYRDYSTFVSGISDRPYSVAHLRSRQVASGIDLTWVRRTRVEGDGWVAEEVPLGESQERYAVQVVAADGLVLRRVETTLPQWTYSDAMRGVDGPDAVSIEVAQVSDKYGTGPFRATSLPPL